MCRFETPPCLDSKRSRVCQYTRRRFESRHGGVSNPHTGEFSTVFFHTITQPYNNTTTRPHNHNNKHKQNTHTTTTQHTHATTPPHINLMNPKTVNYVLCVVVWHVCEVPDTRIILNLQNYRLPTPSRILHPAIFLKVTITNQELFW